MKLAQVAGLTDPGRVRRRNEDSFVCDPPLFAVADGMGGAQAGEIASRLAASAFHEYHEADSLDPEARLRSIIQEANRRIYARASTDPHASGMGTTITAALVSGARVSVGHVGDSRAYLFRDERAGAADRGSLPRRRPRALRPADAGGGRGASAALGDHPRAGDRRGRDRGQLLRGGEGRRRLPPLLGRIDDHARQRPRAESARRDVEPGGGGPAAHRRGERGGRRGQRHRRAVRRRRSGRGRGHALRARGLPGAA